MTLAAAKRIKLTTNSFSLSECTESSCQGPNAHALVPVSGAVSLFQKQCRQSPLGGGSRSVRNAQLRRLKQCKLSNNLKIQSFSTAIYLKNNLNVLSKSINFRLLCCRSLVIKDKLNGEIKRMLGEKENKNIFHMNPETLRLSWGRCSVHAANGD